MSEDEVGDALEAEATAVPDSGVVPPVVRAETTPVENAAPDTDRSNLR